MASPAHAPPAPAPALVAVASDQLLAARPEAAPQPAAGASPWRPGLAPLTAPLPHLRRPAARRLCRGLMLTLGQLVAVEHRERLAAVPEPAIFALNHRNRFEALLAPTVLIYLRRGAPLHVLADWMFVEAPGLGWLLRQSEPVAVYGKPALFKWRDGYRRERLRRRPALDACLDWLARGESVGVFPEGTRNRDAGRLLRGRPGLGELALRSGVPVVPVAIKYPARRPARMVLAIGEPLDFAAERQLAAMPAAAVASIVPDLGPRRPSQPRSLAPRDLSRRVVDRVMAALAAELGKDYAARPGPAGRPGGRHRGHGAAPGRPAAPAPHRRSEAT